MDTQSIRDRLRRMGDPARAAVLRGFFKTGPGQYAEGDVFVGIRVPELRQLAKECLETSAADAEALLASAVHEERLLALLILIRLFAEGTPAARQGIYRLYLRNTRFVNNWDLVDLSAEHIVGAHLNGRRRAPLYRLARSRSLWERRIAILSTFHFIRRGDFGDTLSLSRLLLGDREDLIHKAVGWLLREVGKRDVAVEEAFLKEHYAVMPRTMLRYAIERFPETRRQQYLKGTV